MRDQQINTFHKGMQKDLANTIPQEGLYVDGKNIRIMSDGDSSESAVVVSVEGTVQKIILTHRVSYEYTGTSEEGNQTILVVNQDIVEDIPCTIIGYTIIENTLVTFSYCPDMPVGFNPSSVIHSIDLNTFNVQEIYSNPDLNFNTNFPIEAVGRYESLNIQRVYWTDNLNPVRTLNIKADLSDIESVEDLNLSPVVAFNRLEIDSVDTGGNLTAGMYQYIYRLKSSQGALTRFSQPSNFIHIVSGSVYWSYNEDPEDQNEYNGTTPGNETNKKVTINLTALDPTYEVVEVVAIYRTTSSGFTNVSIVGESTITDLGTARIIHSSNEGNIPISIEEATAFNMSFTAVKTIEEKDNRLFLGNIKQSTASLLFDATSKRYRRNGDDVLYPYKSTNSTITYTEFNNPYNNLNNWWDNENALFKYQEDGVTLGGTGTYIDFKFTKEIITGNSTSNTSENLPYISGSITGDYKSPIISEKFKGYQRDEVYRFGIVLYDKVGNPGFVNWIADIRFPAVEDVDKDGIAGIYNYTIAQTDGDNNTESGANYKQDFDDASHTNMVDFDFVNGIPEVNENSVSFVGTNTGYGPLGDHDFEADGTDQKGNLYALGIQFRLKNLPNELKNNVGGYSFVRVKRTSQDKSTLAVGALTNYLHYYDPSTQNNSSTYYYYSANKDLSYITANIQGGDVEAGGESQPNVGIGDHKFINISSPEFDFTDEYLDVFNIEGISGVNQLDEEDTRAYAYSHYVRILGGMLGKNKSHITSSSSNVRSLVYNSHIVSSQSAVILQDLSTRKYMSFGLAFSQKHGVGDYIDSPFVATTHQGASSIAGVAGQAMSYDDDLGDFLGAWNIETQFTISDTTLNLKKSAVGEKCLFAIVDPNPDNSNQGIYWKRYGLNHTVEVYDNYYGNQWDKLLVAVKKTDAYLTRYGGYDETSVSSSVYMSTGHFSKYNPNSSAVSYEKVFGGDTYVTMYDITKNRKAAEEQGDSFYPTAAFASTPTSLNMAFPVETTINTTLRQGYHFANKKDFSVTTETPLNQFIYNPTYSSENDVFSYIPAPVLYNEVAHFSNRIVFSNVKSNNETADSFRTILPGNYKDIDGNLGGINKLLVHQDIMYYLQDTAFGLLSINPVSTIADKEGSNIVLGIGRKVIQDFKNITTYSGCKEHRHAISAQSGLYWLDVETKKAYSFNPSPRKGLIPLSDSKYMKSYFNKEYDFLHTCLGYDSINNEVLFSTGDETIVYSELLNTFTSRYSMYTSLFVNHYKMLFSLKPGTELGIIHQHNLGDVATFYGESHDVEIEFVVNKNPLYTKVFDNLEWYSEGGNVTQDLISEAEFEDSSGSVQIDFDDNTSDVYFPYKKVKEKMTKTPVPRNLSQYRFRDTYIKIKLRSTSTAKLVLHYVKTLFRISRR